MDCNQAQELLSPYLDGELDPEETEGIKEHLHICSRCREDYAALRDTVSIISGLASEVLKAPAGIQAAVLAGLEESEEQKQPKRSRKWVVPAAAAAVLLLGLLWGNNLWERSMQQQAQIAQQDFSQSEESFKVRKEAAPENAGNQDTMTRETMESAQLDQNQMPLAEQEMRSFALPQEDEAEAKTEQMAGIQGFAAEEGRSEPGGPVNGVIKEEPVLSITGQPGNRLEVTRVNIELILQKELNAQFWQTYDAVVVKETETEISVELPQGNLERLIKDLATIGVVQKQEWSTEDFSEELREARLRLLELETNSQSDGEELARQRELLAGLESKRDKVHVSVKLVQ